MINYPFRIQTQYPLIKGVSKRVGIRLAAVSRISSLGRKTPGKLEGVYASRLTSARVVQAGEILIANLRLHADAVVSSL
jgi:hypothetical protein